MFVRTDVSVNVNPQACPVRVSRWKRFAPVVGMLALSVSPADAQSLVSTLVGTPVKSSRAWANALAPNPRGGWNFITQFYEYQTSNPTEYVVLDLNNTTANNCIIFEGPTGRYTNSNFVVAEQARASNERIFMPELGGDVAYYEPSDESIQAIGPVSDPTLDTIVFTFMFGKNGKLYGGTQTKGTNYLPAIVEVDPVTLAHRIIGRVGQNRTSYSYAYYLAVDGDWVYAGVGQDPWQLSAININTGEHRLLGEVAAPSFISFNKKPEGWVASLWNRSTNVITYRASSSVS